MIGILRGRLLLDTASKSREKLSSLALVCHRFAFSRPVRMMRWILVRGEVCKRWRLYERIRSYERRKGRLALLCHRRHFHAGAVCKHHTEFMSNDVHRWRNPTTMSVCTFALGIERDHISHSLLKGHDTPRMATKRAKSIRKSPIPRRM